jgi:hypothetical protein
MPCYIDGMKTQTIEQIDRQVKALKAELKRLGAEKRLVILTEREREAKQQAQGAKP